MGNKIYLNDIPVDLFLDYYSAYSQNNSELTPLTVDIKKKCHYSINKNGETFYFSQNFNIAPFFGLTSLTKLTTTKKLNVYKFPLFKDSVDPVFLVDDPLTVFKRISLPDYFETDHNEILFKQEETTLSNEKRISYSYIKSETEIDYQYSKVEDFFGEYSIVYYKPDSEKTENGKRIAYFKIKGNPVKIYKISDNNKTLSLSNNGIITEGSPYIDSFTRHQNALRKAFFTDVEKYSWKNKVNPYDVIVFYQNGDPYLAYYSSIKKSHKYTVVNKPDNVNINNSYLPYSIYSVLETKTSIEKAAKIKKEHIISFDDIPKLKGRIYGIDNTQTIVIFSKEENSEEIKTDFPFRISTYKKYLVVPKYPNIKIPLDSEFNLHVN